MPIQSRMTVAQVMTQRVIALGPGDGLLHARETMDEAGVRHMPVVDAQGRLVGIVSDRDVHRAIDLMRTAEGRRGQGSIGDVMHRDVRTVRPGDSAAEAAALMIERKIGALPVVDEDERLVGIVTETDFLVVAQQALLGLEPAARAEA